MILNWNIIKDGETFQSLMNTLIIFDDHKAKIFGRKGKDSAIDASSGDGKIIFQHKLRATPSEIISAALDDLEQIKKYRKNKTDPNYSLWKDIKKWCLTTNVAFNPNDLKKWEEKVIPAFKNEGFDEIKIWYKSIIESKLINYPEITNAFFEGRNRIFLSLPEIEYIFKQKKFSKYGLDIDFIGRQKDFEKVEKFIGSDNKYILPIHGSGGVGKTRFIFEASKKNLENQWGDVYWVNIEEMESSNNWSNTLVPGRKTLLILDEPTEPNLLISLFERISLQSINTTCWKAIIITRTPKDPVINILRDAKHTIIAPEIIIEPLIQEKADTLIDRLINIFNLENIQSENMKRLKSFISKQCKNYPIWIIFIMYLLKEKRNNFDPPKDEWGLAKLYLNEVLQYFPEKYCSKPQFNKIIQWLALYQPLNVEDVNLLRFIKEDTKMMTEKNVLSSLDNLLQRGFINKRGRLLEINPDVIRDYILRNWLLQDKFNSNKFEPSSECDKIVDFLLSEKSIPNPEKVIKSLTRIELDMKFNKEEIDIITPLIIKIRSIIKTENILVINKIREVASLFAPSRIIEFCEISKLIRETKKDSVPTDNPFFKEYQVSHKDAILELSWNIFEIAQYAKNDDESNAIINEMIELVKYEGKLNDKELGYFRNDGKRALSLLPRIIIGEPGFIVRYDQLAYEKVKIYMDRLKSDKQIQAEEQAVLEAILEPLISIERMVTTSEGNQFVFHKRKINLEGQEASIRNEIKEYLWRVVEDENIHIDNKIFAWKLLEETHVSANRSGWEGELKDDLIRVKKLIEKKELSLEELQKAKEIWNWHLQFDKEKRPEFYRLAEDCKKIYLTYDDNKVEKYSKIFSFESDIEVIKKNAKSIADELIQKKSSNEIKKFIDWSIRFVSDDKFWFGIQHVAFYLGQDVYTDPNIQEYIKNIIQDSNSSQQHRSFALAILSEWLRKLRFDNKDAELNEVLENHLLSCPSDENKRLLIVNVYNKIRPDRFGKAKDVELNILEKYSIPIVQSVTYSTNLFNILGSMFDIDFNRIKKIIEQCFKELPSDKITSCYSSLIDGIHFRLIFKEEFPVSFGKQEVHWILDQLVMTPDLDNLGDHVEWILNDFFQYSEKLPLEWLLEFIKTRLNLNKEKPDIYSNKIIPWTFKIYKFIQIISENDKEDVDKKGTLKSLLGYNLNNNLLSYELPDLMIDIDPNGLMLPELLLEEIHQAISENNLDKIIPWSKYAGQYQDNKDIWCKLSKPILDFAIEKCGEEQRKRLYSSLYSKVHEIESWWGFPDELHSHYQEKVNKAQKDYDNEKDSSFKSYFKWCLDGAEAEKRIAERKIEENE